MAISSKEELQKFIDILRTSWSSCEMLRIYTFAREGLTQGRSDTGKVRGKIGARLVDIEVWCRSSTGGATTLSWEWDFSALDFGNSQ